MNCRVAIRVKTDINGICHCLFPKLSMPKFLAMVGADLVVHSIGERFENNKACDLFWHSCNLDVLPYLIGNQTSQLLGRQLCSSVSRFHRYAVTSMFSSFDPTISAILHFVIPMNCFSSRNSHIRQFKRKMLTCARNRGIYNDIAYINLTKNIQTDYGRNMAKNQPLFDRSAKVFQNSDNSLNENDHNEVYLRNQSPDYLLKYEEMRTLFEEETQYCFDSVFKGISEKPSSVRNDFAEYDAILSTGEDVTITVIQPNILRLRNIDLFPIKVARTFFDFLPFQYQ